MQNWLTMMAKNIIKANVVLCKKLNIVISDYLLFIYTLSPILMEHQSDIQRNRIYNNINDADSYYENVALELENLPISRRFVVSYIITHLSIDILCFVFLGLYGDKKCNYDIQTWFMVYIFNDLFCVCIKLYIFAKHILEYMINSTDYPILYFLRYVSYFTSVGLLISGSILFYNPGSECHNKSPYLDKLGIIVVSVNWLLMCMPMVLCLVTCICFPCIVFLVLKFGDRQGASETDLSLLPIKKCTEVIDGMSCCICAEDYKIGDNIKTLHCNHEFHATCVDQWLKINPSCPYCRASILDNNNNDIIIV